MRYLFFVLAFGATVASAAPLDDLTNEQKQALGELFGGYSDSFLCNKPIDFDVAGAFIKSKVGAEISAKKAAEMAHMAVGIHIVAVVRHQKEGQKQKDKQAGVKAFCAQFQQAFGPEGTVIRGLVK